MPVRRFEQSCGISRTGNDNGDRSRRVLGACYVSVATPTGAAANLNHDLSLTLGHPAQQSCDFMLRGLLLTGLAATALASAGAGAEVGSYGLRNHGSTFSLRGELLLRPEDCVSRGALSRSPPVLLLRLLLLLRSPRSPRSLLSPRSDRSPRSPR